MSGVKDYAKQITKGYTSALTRLQKKYDALSGALDEEYLARDREIRRENVNSKNSASANYKTSLANAQKNLLDRGLAGSGESVNTEIRSNLSKNQAFAALDGEAEKARTENALSRSREKSKLISARLDEEAALEADMNRALREQYNADREYEADCADAAEDARRWEAETAEDKRRWEAETAESSHRWKTENAQKVADAEQKREFQEKEFAADEAQRAFDNWYRQIKFEADEEQRAFENSVTASEKNVETDKDGNTVVKGDKSNTTREKVVPEYDADELVNKIFEYYDEEIYDWKTRNGLIKKSIYKILNDTTLDPAYKTQVRVYASAMGYI